jgi:hypothetical protein
VVGSSDSSVGSLDPTPSRMTEGLMPSRWNGFLEVGAVASIVVYQRGWALPHPRTLP